MKGDLVAWTAAAKVAISALRRTIADAPIGTLSRLVDSANR